MKYEKPYYADNKPLPERPFFMAEFGLALFLKLFEKEIKEKELWRRQPSTAQLLLERASWLHWHPKEAAGIRARAKPYIALFEEAFAKDPKKAIQIYNEIMLSYSEIQHSAYARDYTPAKDDDYVRVFNHYFDEYRFRYEELLNRLISIAYGCTEIIAGKPPQDGAACLNIDANPKVARLKGSSLPSAMSYENIHVSIDGIKPGIRNGLSHGGRRTQIPDKKKFLLEDKSGWKEEYSIEEFRNELDVLDRTITSLEFAALVINMNHVRELSELRKELPHQFSQDEKSQVMYTAARDCELEMLEAESKPPLFEVKLRFTPYHPRESEIFGNLGGGYFSQKIPARTVDLKGQVFRFIHFISVILEKDTPGVSVEVYAPYGEERLARAEIADVAGFEAAAKEIKGYDDNETKKKVEDKHVKWERFAWADGEEKPDGAPVQNK